MLSIRFEKLRLNGAELGEQNCLPDIGNNAYIRTPIHIAQRVPEKDRTLLGQGMISTILPYQMQDRYNRNRGNVELDAAVLENEYLCATFIPELGGRLWSLYDKKQECNLLYTNTVFQPANLALRNAWFSGGVEWNVGIKGHSPLTCSRLFANKCENQNGETILRMYEYERIRGVVYSVYAALECDVLLIHVQIENTEARDKYMYWWSNAAVEETPNVRVIVPAEHAFVCTYDENGYNLDALPVPYACVTGEATMSDITYPERFQRSYDYFYQIPEESAKWIAAVNKNGSGIVQFSESILVGRKLFAWGNHQGGRHWCEWLSDRDTPYIEIQAGLLQTQLEHFIMKGCSQISWTEGYGAICGSPELLHGKDYHLARAEIEQTLKEKTSLLSADKFTIVREYPPTYMGSGWGALENKIRPVTISRNAVFPEDSFNDEQYEWLCLLHDGALPEHDVNTPITSYVAGEFWIKLLEKCLRENWYDYYHLGVMYYAEDEIPQAYECFQTSVRLKENPWALRNLAQLYRSECDDPITALKYLERSISLKPDYPPLLEEYARALVENKRYDEWILQYDNLPSDAQANGRLRYFLAVCYGKTGAVQDAIDILSNVLPIYDIREGEYSLSALWIELHGHLISEQTGVSIDTLTQEQILTTYPLPRALDFRMC